MARLRIIHINQADLATSLAASTTIGALVAANLLTDRKIEVHRSTGTSVTYTATWSGGVSLGGVALPATNLTAAATMRARAYSDTACTALLGDTGVGVACPGLALGLWAWPGVLNANAFAYGGGAKAVAWFASNLSGVKGLKIDLADAGNPAGYIDCARLVAGPWWSPAYNVELAGLSTTVVDTTVNTRTLAGDLSSERGPMYQDLSFSTPILGEADRSQLMQIMRGNGSWKPVFVSLMPRTGGAAEQDHMVYGKRKGGPVDHPGLARFSHTHTVEGW